MIEVKRDYRIKGSCCTYTKGLVSGGYKFDTITILLEEPITAREVGHELLHALFFILFGKYRSWLFHLVLDYISDWLHLFITPKLFNLWRNYLKYYRGSRSRFPIIRLQDVRIMVLADR